jgi:hypothetical protein
VPEDLERAVGPDRRTFIKRLVIGTAFAAPVVSSFTMSGVQAVFGAKAGAILGLANSNCTVPPAPPNYPRPIDTFAVGVGGLDVTVPDDGVTLHLVVPAGALPPGTCISIYGADLAALQPLVPSGETPVSGYAVVWGGKGPPVATSPITLQVTDPAVSNGDPIYKFDKVTGVLISQGSASGHTWTVTFVEDPSFVVTGQSDDDDDEKRKAAAQPATPVAAEPQFTG